MSGDRTVSPTPDSRWWLNPALVRLAFGTAAKDRRSGGSWSGGERLGLDLDDPEQRTLGEFELLELIGEGGMGLVYRARQLRLQREVAVKLLSAGPWASPDFVARFRQEARHAARLHHPAIVTVHEMGELDGLVYYAMQLVRGDSLARHLQRHGGRLPDREAASMLRGIAEAVDYAHSLGVLHLDLKPANVLLDEQGQPRITDFGLARLIEPGGALDNPHVAGTPGYMAPEQVSVDSAFLTRATDIWGLGAILYELLCGQPPFEAADASTTLALSRQGRVRKPSQIRPMSADLEAICLKCLAREPADRYPDARALADDLGRFIEGRPVSVRPLGAGRRSLRWARREPRLAAALVLVVVSLVAGLLATSLQWRRAEHHAGELRSHLWAQRVDAAAATLEAQAPLEALPALAANLTEQEAAGERAQAETGRLRIAAALDRAPALVDLIDTGDALITSLAIDPQGEWLASAGSHGMVRLYDLASGEQRWASSLPAGGRISLVDDGRHLLLTPFQEDLGFLRMRGGGWQELVALADGRRIEPPPDDDRLSIVLYSPDASHALVGLRDPVSGVTRLHLRELASGRTLGEPWPMHRGTLLLAPAAAALAVAPFSGEASGFRAERLELRDPGSFELRWRHHHADGDGIRAWEFSPDGRWLAVGYHSGEVQVFDVADGDVAPLRPQAAATIQELRFSEDGGWLAAASDDGEIRVWDLDARRLLVPPLRSGNAGNGLELNRAERSLLAIVQGATDARLWRLPAQPGEGVAEVVVGRFPRHAPPVQGGAQAARLAPGLLATARGGELRVWRLRSPQALPAPLAAVPNAAPPLQGGAGLLAVGDRTVRLLNPVSGQPLGPPLAHPQAVAFSALRPGTEAVLSTAGAWLHGRDGRSGAASFAPVALPASPAAMLPGPDGARILLAFNRREGRENRLALESRDAATGVLLAAAELPGPQWRLRYSQGGGELLAWRDNEIHLFAADTLVPLRAPLRFGADVAGHRQRWSDGEAIAPLPTQLDVREAVLGGDGRSLWLGLGRGGEDGYQLRRIDLATGAQRFSWPLTHFPMAMEPLERGDRLALLLLSENALLIHAGDGSVRKTAIEGLHTGSQLASSLDGRRLAVSSEGGVQVFDSSDGRWLSPFLPVPMAAGPSELLFDADGRALTVRSADGRAWRLPLEPERRSLDELQVLAGLLDPARSGHAEAAQSLDPGARVALRAADPGPPPPVPAPLPPSWDIDFAASEPRFVDLRPGCNRHYHDPHDHLWFDLHLRQLPPPGRHRLAGQEFELRCAVLAAWRPEEGASVALGSRIEGIAVPAQQAAALHLLVAAPGALSQFVEMPYAWLELAYADGGHARLAVLWRRQVAQANMRLPDVGDAAVAYTALGGTGIAMSLKLVLPSFYAVRLENPYPERELVGLAWESVRTPHSHPLLLAATVEHARRDPADPGLAAD